MSQPQTELSTRAHSDDARVTEDLMLVVLNGIARGTKVRLKPNFTIGKSKDNDLVLPDDTVSRHHCQLSRVAAGVLVKDLGSTNHTRVGQTVISEATLTPGGTLTVGDVDLTLRLEISRAQVLPSEQDVFGEALGKSLSMRNIFGVLERIALTDASVLLEGETGTGKDVLARSIHAVSPRRDEPFIVVDCGAISYSLIESELFGHERGAFTGAVALRTGAFESAGRGTLFLDEVGELPMDVQPKLLRVLEAGEYRRVGGNRGLQNEARIVAATKRDLKQEVERGKFREDLYFRLAVVPLTVPPLRSRREDIPPLIEHFLTVARKRDPSASEIRLDTQTIAALAAHDWPGNVRELRNVLDRALYLATASGETELRLVDLPVTPTASHGEFSFIAGRSYRDTRNAFEAEFEKRYVTWLLDRHAGNISAGAREASMDRKHLYDLAKKHGLRGKNNRD